MPYTSSAPEFYLNFLQVTLSTDQFTGGVLPFVSSEHLRNLRAEHKTTHVIQRQGDEIISIPLIADAATLGNPQTFRVQEASSLVRRLIQDAILRFVYSQGFTFTDFDPPTFIFRHPQRDLLARAVGAANRGATRWLHVYPQYTLSPRSLNPRTGVPVFGILVNFHTHREIELTVADLLMRGLEMHGRYVRTAGTTHSSTDGRRDPAAHLRLIGRVREVQDNTLKLEDAPSVSEVLANQSWLEARRENFEACLYLTGLPNVPDVLRKLDEEMFRLTGAQGRRDQVVRIAEWLSRQGALTLATNLTCLIGSLWIPRSGHNIGMYRRFPAPVFRFDSAGTKTDTWHDRGLEAHGPFDTESFTTKRPRIAVVTPKEYQGDVEVFLRKFKDGIPQAKAFRQGFVRKYHLNDCTFHFEVFDPNNREATAYRQACLRVLNMPSKPDLAFVVIQDHHKQYQGDQDSVKSFL